MGYRNSKTIDDQIRVSVNKAVGDALRKTVTTEYVEKLKDRIVDRTQLGIGVDIKTGNSKPLDKLSDNYIEQRSGKARWYTTKSGKKVKVTKEEDKSGEFVKKPKLANTTTPSFSNLTATGQLLKSLTVVKNKIKGGVIYYIRIGDRRGRDLFGYQSKIGNKKLANILADQGRTFFGFTKSQKNQISREIRQMIRKFLR